MISLSSALHTFTTNRGLDSSYIAQAEQVFSSAITAIVAKQQALNNTLVVGVNGCQGSGKSTLVEFLSLVLTHQYQLSCVCLSLDDFYFNQSKRQQLANDIHPLLATRGVPGTHDLVLAKNTITDLLNGTATLVPRFDKANDNPFPRSQWPKIENQVDVILLEGWCLAVQPQAEQALKTPVNQLEAQQDTHGIWRRYVNRALEDYQGLHQHIDFLMMLEAPSFDCVYRWRQQQERQLARSVAADNKGVMNDAQVKAFIAYFERLTRHSLASLPPLCDVCFQLDEQRQVITTRWPKYAEP